MKAIARTHVKKKKEERGDKWNDEEKGTHFFLRQVASRSFSRLPLARKASLKIAFPSLHQLCALCWIQIFQFNNTEKKKKKERKEEGRKGYSPRQSARPSLLLSKCLPSNLGGSWVVGKFLNSTIADLIGSLVVWALSACWWAHLNSFNFDSSVWLLMSIRDSKCCFTSRTSAMARRVSVPRNWITSSRRFNLNFKSPANILAIFCISFIFFEIFIDQRTWQVLITLTEVQFEIMSKAFNKPLLRDESFSPRSLRWNPLWRWRSNWNDFAHGLAECRAFSKVLGVQTLRRICAQQENARDASYVCVREN